MSKRPSTIARVRPRSDIVARPVEWLWPGWIPLGKATVPDGDPGLGKSTLLLDLAGQDIYPPTGPPAHWLGG